MSSRPLREEIPFFSQISFAHQSKCSGLFLEAWIARANHVPVDTCLQAGDLLLEAVKRTGGRLRCRCHYQHPDVLVELTGFIKVHHVSPV